MKIRVLVNPRAGAGAAQHRAAQLRNLLQHRGLTNDIVFTNAPGHATRLAERARDDGIDVLGIVGGDGTVNEVAQAYLDRDGTARPGPDIALIPAGTGGDFGRTFGLSRDLPTALERLLAASPRPLDLGVVDLVADDGAPLRRAFLNIASFGVAGRIDRLVNAGPKWMGGRAAFFVGTLRALAAYRNQAVRVRVDGALWQEDRIVNVAIANGRFFGGGMQVAPHADPSDGLFDVVKLGNLTVAESVGLTGKIYRGTHLGAPKIAATRGRVVEAEAIGHEPVLIDLDGEAPGRLPLTATVLPGALRLRV